MESQAPAPAAQAAPEAPSVEMNVPAFEAALASPPGKEAAAPVEQKPAEKPTEAKPAEKPAEEKPADDKTKKKGLDALPDEEVEKKPDAEEKPAVEEEPEIDTKNWAKVQRDAFAAARVKAKLLATERDDARAKAAELEKRLTESPKDAERWKEKVADLERQRDEAESKVSILNVKESAAWKAEVVAPIDRVFSALDEIAEAAGIPPETLRAATDEDSSFKRARALKKALDSSEDVDAPSFLTAAIAEAEKLPPLYAKMGELESKSRELKVNQDNQTAAQKEAAAKAAEAKYLESHNHIAEQLKRKLPSLFADADVAKDIADARPSEDPADVAFATQAAVLLPKLAEERLELKAEIAKLKESEAALLGSRGTVEKAAETTRRENPDGEMDEDALAAALRAGK